MKNIYQISEQYKIFISLFISFIALMLLYFPSVGIDINFFHNDDARLFEGLNKIDSFDSGLAYVFNADFFKFRPVSNLQYMVEFLLFNKWIAGFILYNIFLVLVANYAVLKFISASRGVLICVMLSLVIVTSKYFVYSIWNVTGSFESLALILFLFSVYYIFISSDSSSSKISRGRIYLLLILLLLSNERYLPYVVLVPSILAFHLARQNPIKAAFFKFHHCSIILLVYLGGRYLSGLPLIVGTQTDNIVDSFSLSETSLHFAKGISELLGFSFGPKYLTGFEFVDWVPFNALLNNHDYIIGFFISCLLFIITFYLYFFKICMSSKKTIWLALVLGLMVLASSVTIRLELRWLSPAYVLLILFVTLTSIPRMNIDPSRQIIFFDRAVFVAFVFLSLTYNAYYELFCVRAIYFAEKLHDVSMLFHWLH